MRAQSHSLWPHLGGVLNPLPAANANGRPPMHCSRIFAVDAKHSCGSWPLEVHDTLGSAVNLNE